MRKQWGIEKTPTLKSTPEQYVNDNNVINIQLLYDPNCPIKLELWDGNF